MKIEDMIYEIRGKQVMLDSDLAKLYHVETKRINEAVYRNKEKFPERISWILTNIEVQELWSQNATANISNMSRTNPRVFVEQGVYMLATILKSKEIEIDKFNEQYNNKLKVIRTNKFHDRYIIIDNTYIYHMGTSINYLGEKVFSINKLEDEFVIDNLLEYVNKFLNEKL